MKFNAKILPRLWAWGGAHPPLIRKIIMVVNVTTLLMIVSLVQVSAVGFGQIRLNEKNTSLEKVFRTIEKQTDYVFFSQDIDIDNIDIHVRNASIETALDACFKGLPLTYKIIGKTIVVKKVEDSVETDVVQGILVEGKVTDAAGDALPGVAVRLRGTAEGTVTGTDGHYSFTVPDGNAVLVFSFIGFASQEVTVGNAHLIDIKLQEETSELNEVVIVGYGTQKKINLTGAVDVVQGEDLTSRPAAQVGQLLQGQAPSMLISMNQRGNEPGVSQSFQIRGVGSIDGDTAPLVLVDGVEMDINLVDPSSIESISVLKDAASSAIYGSRAATGVILIQTKHGSDRPLRISYSNITSMNRPIYVPNMEDSYTYATVFNQARANAGLSPTFGPEQVERIKGYMEGTYPYPYDPDQPPNSIWQGRWMGNANVDWAQQYFADYTVQQKHNINVEGGTDKTQYFANIGLLDQPGIFKWGNDSYKRYNFLANVSTRANDWLKFDFSARA
ncbi:MAG TPA: SusC/RagA family TonB-linked outer membrane protein, partial [Chryseosolibacter sp.]|nr:SusC/RagA family TonB-linked outer membrane protein [Chryseosolibacter sp.]